MARKLGHEYKLFVSDGSSGWNQIQGQKGLTKDQGTNLINQSDKTVGQYDVQAPGRKNLTITCTGNKVLPDANGLERAFNLQTVDPQVPEGWQIRVTPFTASDVVFQGEMYISNFNDDSPDQENSTYSFQLTCAAAPTVDQLAP